MAQDKLTWKIGGEAGYGIMVTGLMFSKIFSRSGFHVFDTVEYPSLIRGGHNTYHVRVEDEEINSNIELIDILVALNKEAVDRHKGNMAEDGIIIFDSKETKIGRDEVRKDIKLYDVPLLDISKEISGKKIMRNTVALGASVAALDYGLDMLFGVITDTFGDKGDEVVRQNIDAAKKGYDYVKENYKEPFKAVIKKKEGRRLLLTGNEAIALGAIRAGCNFYSAYPMTPASSILHYMASHEKDKNIVVKQTEDEIAAIHAAIGASFAGVRAMTATSGGGFCLMTEGLGLAAITETPLVLALCQRPGPSTGLATMTEQGDLKFALNASQGEFPRVVMTPGDVEECFYLTLQAFNIADKYLVQVIIISDKHLSESHKTAERFNTSYKVGRSILGEKDVRDDYRRFENTEKGVSFRTLPGGKGVFRAPSYEHDEYGWNNEEIWIRNMMADKRMRKAEHILKEIPDPKTYGDADPDITIISCGSTKGAVLDAIKFLRKDRIKANLVHLNFISPFKKDAVTRLIKKAKKTIIVEQNKTLQFAGIIKENTGLDIDYSFSKYDGRQMLPHEIYDRIKEVLGKR